MFFYLTLFSKVTENKIPDTYLLGQDGLVLKSVWSLPVVILGKPFKQALIFSSAKWEEYDLLYKSH